MGIEKIKLLRSRQTVYWTNVNSDIKKLCLLNLVFVKDKGNNNTKKPLFSHPIPICDLKK